MLLSCFIILFQEKRDACHDKESDLYVEYEGERKKGLKQE